MRIGVNLIPLRPGQVGGAEIYVRDLLAGLLAHGGHELVLVTADYNHDTLPADSPRCRRVLFHRESAGGSEPAAGPGLGRRALRWLRARYRGLPVAARDLLRPAVRPVARAVDDGLDRLRERRRRHRSGSLRELIARERLDLWFCPFTDLDPRISPVPGVITVHDVQHEYLPEFFSPEELRHRRHFYPESCSAADHVIAVSEFTRRCVLDRYGVDPEAVSVIWEAAGSDLDWRGGHERAALARQRYALPSRYVLYPANTWHHKNHERLIEALALYRRAHGESPTLVLTGVGKEGQAGLDRAIEAAGLRGLVRMLGYVARGDLPPLYAGAACLAFPSLFEGFGIPLVEAMLAGCPIVASNVTSIPEVVGDAAVLFDPLDPADIARALAAVLRDPSMAAELTCRGRARAELFSPARTAALTLELFERVVTEGRTRGRVGRELIAVDGVYDDRWIGREVAIAVSGATLTSVEIEGHLAEIPFLLPQTLVVRLGGVDAQVIPLAGPGPFRVRVPLPVNGGPARMWEVSLLPARTFCPVEQGLSTDSRVLGVQLTRVRAETRDGREIVKTLGAAAGGERA